MAADGGGDRPLVLPQPPDGNGLVDPRQGVVLELLRQGQMGLVVLGGDQQAAGVPVDPVDDAWAQLPVDAGQGIPAVEEQGVDQGTVRVAGGRVDH